MQKLASQASVATTCLGDTTDLEARGALEFLHGAFLETTIPTSASHSQIIVLAMHRLRLMPMQLAGERANFHHRHRDIASFSSLNMESVRENPNTPKWRLW